MRSFDSYEMEEGKRLSGDYIDYIFFDKNRYCLR